MLDDTASNNVNEVYVKLGSPPTRGDYDYRFSSAASSDQQILIPKAASGTWYVLVYANTTATPCDFTLQVETADLLLESVNPRHSGIGADARLTITGAGFDGATRVELVGQGGVRYAASDVEVVSMTQLIAAFSAGSVPVGDYSVLVSGSGGSSDVLPNAFEMTESFGAKLETNLIVPRQVGYHTVATVWVEYANTGDVAMPAPLLMVTAEQNGLMQAIMKRSGTMPPSGFWTSAMPRGFSSTVQFLATGDTPGILQPGESRRVPIQYAGWRQPWDFLYPPMLFKLGVIDADNTTPIDWSAFKESMRPDSISTETWEPLWANFTTQNGETWGQYVSMLATNAAYLGRLGLQVVDIGELLSFQLAKADGMNMVQTLAASTDAYAEAPGLDLVFRRVFPQSIASRYRMGPFGRGWFHNWQVTFGVEDDGTVTITEPNGVRRVYQPDSRPGGNYFAGEGDYGTLTNLGGGSFALREKNGLLRVFNAEGKLHYTEDTNGNRITCEYDGGKLVSLTHSAGQALQLVYNSEGHISTITDPVGRVTRFTYDASDEHLTSATYFDGSVVGYSYSLGTGITREHALTEVVFPGGSHQYFAYDARGRMQTASGDDGAEALSFSYDNMGMVAVADALGNTSRYYLDHRGLLHKAVDPKGDTVRLEFDQNFNLARITDPAGFAYRYEYDARGNLLRMTDPMGYGTRFSYTAVLNRMTTLTDAKGNITNYGYDAKGNLSSITYPNGTVERWGYDPNGRLASWMNRRGNKIQYEFDGNGRLTAKTYPDGSRVQYTYDSHGNLVSASDATGTTSLEYDAQDHLEKLTYPGDRWLEYTYNVAGRRASMVDQLGHRSEYHYDAVGRLERMTDETGLEMVHYFYDAAGRLERKVIGNGVFSTYTYDAAGQLARLSNRKPDDSILSQFDYTYDSRGRRVSMTTTYGAGDPRIPGTWHYDYDDLGQLIGWTAPDGQHVEYEYDPLGNRITVNDDGVITHYTTNNMNQYTQVGDATYEYDADGNLTRSVSPLGITSYFFDVEKRLFAAQTPESSSTYTYDAFGSRVRVSQNNSHRDFIIDPIGFGDVVGEYDHYSGSLVSRYTHGLGLLSMSDVATGPMYYTFDALGSTHETTDGTGTISSAYSYDSFGDMKVEAGDVHNPLKFVGEYGVIQEGKGLAFMRARYYDPGMGRFVTADPIQKPLTNLYQYSANAPNLYIDPCGLAPEGSLTWWEQLGSTAKTVVRDVTFGLLHLTDLVQLLFAWMDVEEESQRQGNEPGYATGKFLEGIRYFTISPHERALNEYNAAGKLPTPPVEALEEKAAEAAQTGDPNEKIGPSGYGAQGLICSKSPFPYRVNFENEASATAPAQIVTISDPVDSDLDWSTFALTGIGYGDVTLAVPAATQHFETIVPTSYNGTSFEVQIEAGIHLATGEVYARFYSIDPLTGLPPTVDIGFLPPEDGTGRGKGFFTYVIKPKASLTEGTEIRNVAYIKFDFLEPISTNQVDPHDPSQGTDPNKECLNTIAPPHSTLTTSSTEGGSVTVPGEGTLTFDWGKTVRITALSETGYRFTGWSGNVQTVADPSSPDTTIGMYENFSVVANFEEASITVVVKQGFNLIAIPSDVTGMPDLKTWLPTLGDAAQIEKVMVYDPAAGHFVTLIPGDAVNSSFLLRGGEGIIVYAREDREIDLPAAHCSTLDLQQGFNLVGFACPPTGYTAFQLLNQLGAGQAISIQRFAPETGAFETAGFDENGEPVGHDFPIVPGEGYFLFMKQALPGFGF